MLEIPILNKIIGPKQPKSFYKIGHGCIKLMKWICYFDRSYYENKNYYDLMGSILICLKNDN